jgi:hypothetical protein
LRNIDLPPSFYNIDKLVSQKSNIQSGPLLLLLPSSTLKRRASLDLKHHDPVRLTCMQSFPPSPPWTVFSPSLSPSHHSCSVIAPRSWTAFHPA